MANPVVFQSVHPIGETDTLALPVKEIASAIDYYSGTLGFSLVESQSDRAVLQRDGVRIGLACNDSDPEQASCYFAVSDVGALRQELIEKGVEPSPLRVDQNQGKSYRVFFAREPYGVCFCFGQPA